MYQYMIILHKASVKRDARKNAISDEFFKDAWFE